MLVKHREISPQGFDQTARGPHLAAQGGIAASCSPTEEPSGKETQRTKGIGAATSPKSSLPTDISCCALMQSSDNLNIFKSCVLLLQQQSSQRFSASPCHL